jgi:hypothetical protein
MKRIPIIVLAAAACAPAIAQDGPPVTEQELSEAVSPWRVEFTTWIWAMGTEGDVGVRGLTANVSASFTDIIDDSDSLFALSGRLEVGYEKFAVFVDGFYADIGVDNITGPEGMADVDLTFEQIIVDFGAMYRIGDWEPSGGAAANEQNITLDLYAGGRYIDLEMELDPASQASRSADQQWIDPIFGAKLNYPISENWLFNINGDIGGFGVESDFTWSTTAVFGYNFDLFSIPATVLFGYRAYGWDYADGAGQDRFVWDVTQHGPILGLSLRF